MPPSAWWWLLVPWAAWLTCAAVSVIQVRKLRVAIERWPERLKRRWNGPLPPATLIVPFKGTGDDLAACVRTLCTQDYPSYRLVCVVESEGDPAYPRLREELARYPQRPSTLDVAGTAGPRQGQKVHNQLHVLRRLEPEARDGEVWAFADSDALPGPGWLRDLVRPLEKPRKNVVATGYRWLVPEPGGGFWSAAASAVNASVACGYRRDSYSPAWGGAMAVSAAIAREGRLTAYLEGALTDDYQFTRMAHALGGRVYFVPACLSPSPVSFDRQSFWQFARRQYLITRVYAPRLFAGGLGVLLAWWVGCLAGWGALAAALLGTAPAGVGAGAGVTILGVAALHQLRARGRERLVRLAFPPETVARLRPALRLERWGTPLVMAVHLGVMLSACAGRTVRWRGLAYRLRGPQQVERLDEKRAKGRML